MSATAHRASISQPTCAGGGKRADRPTQIGYFAEADRRNGMPGSDERPAGVLDFRLKRRCAAAGERAILRARSGIRRLTRSHEPENRKSTNFETQIFTIERNRP
jgi:hypothetical protein